MIVLRLTEQAVAASVIVNVGRLDAWTSGTLGDSARSVVTSMESGPSPSSRSWMTSRRSLVVVMLMARS